MRVFAALRPAEHVLDQLQFALESVRANAPELRWSPRENWHITTAFYGEVPEGALADLASALGDVASDADAMRLHLAGSGVFSGRTLWIGVAGEGTDTLRTLMAHCAGVCGVTEHRQRAHLTVARTGRRTRGADLTALVRALSVYSGPDWSARELLLYASEPGAGRAGAPHYTALHRFRLGPAQTTTAAAEA